MAPDDHPMSHSFLSTNDLNRCVHRCTESFQPALRRRFDGVSWGAGFSGTNRQIKDKSHPRISDRMSRWHPAGARIPSYRATEEDLRHKAQRQSLKSTPSVFLSRPSVLL